MTCSLFTGEVSSICEELHTFRIFEHQFLKRLTRVVPILPVRGHSDRLQSRQIGNSTQLPALPVSSSS